MHSLQKKYPRFVLKTQDGAKHLEQKNEKKTVVYNSLVKQSPFYKNHEAQNSQKVKNIIRIMPRLKF